MGGCASCIVESSLLWLLSSNKLDKTVDRDIPPVVPVMMSLVSRINWNSVVFVTGICQYNRITRGVIDVVPRNLSFREEMDIFSHGKMGRPVPFWPWHSVIVLYGTLSVVGYCSASNSRS
jgi:hypothetical protein